MVGDGSVGLRFSESGHRERERERERDEVVRVAEIKAPQSNYSILLLKLVTLQIK